MKYIILILGIVFITSCKVSEKQINTDIVSNKTKGKYIGIVSHQYKTDGCKTVVIIQNKDQDKPLILIPINNFDIKYDKDKLKISFDYLTLRIKNPEGCNIGIPAELSNINIE